jgi:hypothetical protein
MSNLAQRRTDSFIKRLVDEWRAYGKIIIGLDFDDTISPWKFTEPEWYKATVSTVQEAQKEGAFVVIHTACDPDRNAEITERCEKLGLKIDGINEVPLKLPYGNHKKMFANIYLDDRAGIDNALYILSTATYWIRGIKANSNLDDIA